ncbi:MAG: hypothetical protein Q9172_002188 [Xanthocarpia lactea]
MSLLKRKRCVAQTETDNQLKKAIHSSAIVDHIALATRNLYIATFLRDFCPSMMASDDHKVIREGNKAVSHGDVWMDRLLWTQMIRNDPRVCETLYGLSPNEVEAYENDPLTLVCLTAHANIINGHKDFQPNDDFHTAFDRYVTALREGGFRVSYHDEPESKEKRAQDEFWMVYASNAKELTRVRDRERLGRTNKRQISKSRIVDVQSSKKILSFYDLPSEIRLSIYNFVFCDHVYHLVRKPTQPQPMMIASHPLFPRPLQAPEPPSQMASRIILEISRNQRRRWAILLTSRQLYHEAVDVFYSASTLRFDDPYVLLGLRTYYLPATGLSALKRLDIVWRCECYHSKKEMVVVNRWQMAWGLMWRLIASDMQLLSLTVCIMMCGSLPQPLDINALWIQPMLQIKGIPRVQVIVESTDKSPYYQGATCRHLHRFSTELCSRMNENGNRMLYSDSEEQQPRGLG